MFDCSKCIKIVYEAYVFFTELPHLFDERKVKSLLISFWCYRTYEFEFIHIYMRKIFD